MATHPASGEVWVANRWSHDVAVGASTADGSMEFRVWRDRAPYHYMARVSALAFDDVGLVVTTCQDSLNEYWGKMDPNLFMGPSLYEVYPCDGYYGRPSWSSNGAEIDVAPAGDQGSNCAPLSSLTLEGKPCSEGSDCWLIHSDMLHEAPLCTGIAHEAGAVTDGGFRAEPLRSGRVFWYLDGLNNELMRYDLSTGHGPGILDHRTANIRRYIDVPVERMEDVPSHMVVDEESRSLFVVRPQSGSVVRVNIDSGRFHRSAQCVPDECYPSHEGYVEGMCLGLF